MSFTKEIFNNPIYIKDLYIRKRQESKKKFRIPGYVGYLAVLILPVTVLCSFQCIVNGASVFEEYNWQQITGTAVAITVFLQLFYFVFKSITASFTLYSSEREQRTYGTLLSSLMTPEDILKGKFFVAFYPLFMELTGFFPVFFGLGMLLNMKIHQIFGTYILDLIVILFFTLLGLYCSLTSGSSAKAHSRSAFIAGFLLVGTLLIDGLISSIAHDFIPFTVFINPGFALGGLLFGGPDSPVWLRALAVVCPFLMLVASYELWKVLSFESSRLPER
ncbi:MAG: hypothetical protein LWY06_17965 [Firmicutes bacterium]|nr:hypothetical protein [Bacillota bacterium]